jgi:hypothetical protein
VPRAIRAHDLSVPRRVGGEAVDIGGRAGAEEEEFMPKYLIEREVPGAGKLSRPELKGLSQKSVGVLEGLGPQIQWVHSYVTGDKVYCIYVAPNEEMIREHARRGGFPANRISKIEEEIDPTTAEG